AQGDQLLFARRRRDADLLLQLLQLLVQVADDFRLLFQQAVVFLLLLGPALFPLLRLLQVLLQLVERLVQLGVLRLELLQVGAVQNARSALRGRLAFRSRFSRRVRALPVTDTVRTASAPQRRDDVLGGLVLRAGQVGNAVSPVGLRRLVGMGIGHGAVLPKGSNHLRRDDRMEAGLPPGRGGVEGTIARKIKQSQRTAEFQVASAAF